ncbi:MULTISPECIES: helix-turn-helix transcriptional regulator [unclassified Nocardiopsis]|uniref:helix-turn-helix transcriptional regulator n=1 Tax=unclassified Nocardiopsis TaxID=2649073 RepID=UPI001F348AAD|nr:MULTISPECIES: helix-turn-helix transcriptional regulator [unclassified Nocardiopsis]
MREAVRQAVATIHRRFSEPITLTDIAAEVFVSPFHLSRVFSQETGVPPGRYLTAVRMFEAKKRLLTSSMTVCDIVYSVGYNSVGTFTSRFTRAVGMSPRQYRQPEVERLLVAASGELNRMPALGELMAPTRRPPSAHRPTGTLNGVVELPRHAPGTTLLIGVYHEHVPQQAPVVHMALPADTRTHFSLTGVPYGSWTVMAIAMRAGIAENRENVFLCSSPNRISVSPGSTSWTRLPMRRLSPTDAPIAVTLADTSLRSLPAHTYEADRFPALVGS